MNNTIFWVALAAYSLHILEEYFYDWKNWASRTLKIPVSWDGFYITNVTVLILGIVCASSGWNNPLLALTYPGLMFINAIFMHILPVILTKRFSPGVITACVCFLPTCLVAFNEAVALGVNAGTIIVATVIGGLVLAYPIILIKTKDWPFFNQKS